MPLLVLCGQPCSGKTTIAAKLAEKLRDGGVEVLTIDESSVGVERDTSYKDSRTEKMTRGMLKAATERSLRGSTVVVLDALNNIKGYRYELWCIAKASKTRYCLVHCELPVETSREWNKRRAEVGYPSEIFEDLAGRFEAPDTRNRWDVPLFRVDPQSETLDAALDAPVAAISGAQMPRSGTEAPKSLQPNIATQNTELSRTNLLNDLDSSTQDIVNAIMKAQASLGPEALGNIHLDDVKLEISLNRAVTIPELRRHKRAFIKLATQNNWTRLDNTQDAKQLFVQYLHNNIHL